MLEFYKAKVLYLHFELIPLPLCIFFESQT